MKKILIFLIGGLLLPLTVYADMGIPENLEYEIEITNPNGVSAYERKCDNDGCKLVKISSKIPYGITSKIYYEEEINDEIYVPVEYNEKEYYVRLSDTTLISKEITLKDKNVSKLKEPVEKKVLVNNLKVYSSPAVAFKVIGTIPKDTIVKITHSSGHTWVYVETPEIRGWINSYNGTIGQYKKNNISLIKETELKDENDKVIATIPANTKFSEYYTLDDWAMALFVEYEGKEGYIFDENVAVPDVKKVKILEEAQAMKKFVSIYECERNPKSCPETITIPKDTELQQVSFYSRSRGTGNPDYYQIEYKGELYWIVEPVGVRFVATIENKQEKVLKKLNIYSNREDIYYDSSNDIIGTIEKGEEITIIYSIDSTHYIETKDGQKGWVDHNLEFEDSSEEPNEEPSEEPNEEPSEEPNEEQETEEIEIKEKGLSKEELLYICIGGAVALSLTAVVVIILVSKKRKIQKQ